MAGLGRRVFAPGEVLTATNVMGYLQDQAVMKFAGTAARGSAIGTAVAEGMVSYLADSDSVQVYDGSAWKNIGPAGQILQVLYTTTTTTVTNTTSTPVSIGLTGTVTPIYGTSKIIVLTSINGVYKNATNSEANLRMYKDGSFLYMIDGDAAYTGNGTANFIGGISSSYVETASTTTSRTFTVMIYNDGPGLVGAQSATGTTSSMIILEVSA